MSISKVYPVVHVVGQKVWTQQIRVINASLNNRRGIVIYSDIVIFFPALFSLFQLNVSANYFLTIA